MGNSGNGGLVCWESWEGWSDLGGVLFYTAWLFKWLYHINLLCCV